MDIEMQRVKKFLIIGTDLQQQKATALLAALWPKALD
jgi:hypothetical protein